MEFSAGCQGSASEIPNLFKETFTASEGSEEGVFLGTLAHRLIEEDSQNDLRVFTVPNDDDLDGATIFSRLTFKSDNRTVFVLGPVAVATKRQRQYIGQRPITHGLEVLQQEGVDFVATYGDPG